jgi:hypothetical protein
VRQPKQFTPLKLPLGYEQWQLDSTEVCCGHCYQLGEYAGICRFSEENERLKEALANGEHGPADHFYSSQHLTYNKM